MHPEPSPYARTLGITVQQTDDGALCTLNYSATLIGSTMLHGGTIASLLKIAATSELIVQERPEHQPALISLTTRFLRAGRPRDTFAKALITRRGSRVVHVEATAWQEDPSNPIASAQASFHAIDTR